jgi:hypothetical protein
MSPSFFYHEDGVSTLLQNISVSTKQHSITFQKIVVFEILLLSVNALYLKVSNRFKHLEFRGRGGKESTLNIWQR